MKTIAPILAYGFLLNALLLTAHIIYTANFGIRHIDKYFSEKKITEWESQFPPECLFRFYKYCFRYITGKQKPELPLKIKLWIYISTILSLVMFFTFAGVGIYALNSYLSS
jgi:hypothetical protein